MPDNDHFEWQLYGKGLRKAYRLARGVGEISEIAEVLRRSVNELLRNGLHCPADIKNDIESAIYGTLNRPLFSEEQNAFGLFQALEQIAALQNNSRGIVNAIQAAKAAFAELSSNSKGGDRETIKKCFQEKLTKQLLDNQFFSKVRGGIMKEQKRILDEQLKWEAQVTQKVISFKQSSSRWFSAKTWDKEQLSQPIAVLEG